MVAAGYWATERRWADADAAWEETLAWAKVDEFHATDFFACRKAFADWKINSRRHIEAIRRFTDIVQRFDLIGFAYGVDLRAYLKLVRPATVTGPKWMRNISPRLFCVAGCLSLVSRMISRFAAFMPRHERVAVLFEDEQGIGDAIAYFEYCKKRHEPWTKWLIGFDTADKGKRPIQMADLLAHEAWRRVTDHVRQTGRPQRKSLGAMLVGQHVAIEFATEESCKEMVATLRGFAAQRDG